MRQAADASQARAFTRVELLVVVALLALIVCVFATARAASRPNFQGALCLNNLKQLMAAFTVYTHDYSEFFPPNWDSTICTWSADNEAASSADAGDPNFFKDPTKNLLVPYIRTNTSLLRCPFDPRVFPYSGTDPKLFGQKIPAIRGISMNAGVGTKGACSSSSPNSQVDGPWLNDAHNHTANHPYATFGKWSDFQFARPSEIWVFVDDDPWTINDAGMEVIAAAPDAVDYVNALNDNSTAFSFADGHAETHKWKSNIWVHNGIPSRSTFDAGAAPTGPASNPGLGYNDWYWFASHATKRVTGITAFPGL